MARKVKEIGLVDGTPAELKLDYETLEFELEYCGKTIRDAEGCTVINRANRAAQEALALSEKDWQSLIAIRVAVAGYAGSASLMYSRKQFSYIKGVGWVTRDILGEEPWIALSNGPHVPSTSIDRKTKLILTPAVLENYTGIWIYADYTERLWGRLDAIMEELTDLGDRVLAAVFEEEPNEED